MYSMLIQTCKQRPEFPSSLYPRPLIQLPVQQPVLTPGRYEMYHSGGSGGLSFSSTGQVKVMIDGGYQSFHRDEISEHKRPGYYTVRRGGKKYNVKYNQFEIDEVEVITQVRLKSVVEPVIT